MKAPFISPLIASDLLGLTRQNRFKSPLMASDGVIQDDADDGHQDCMLSPTNQDIHGTLTSVMLFNGVVLATVESRANETKIIDSKPVKILFSGDEKKIEIVNERVGVTASGSRSRVLNLWKFFEREKYNLRNADLLEVCKSFLQYIAENPLRKGGVPLGLFIIGFSDLHKKCIAYQMGDEIQMKLVEEPYSFMGGGKKAANKILREVTSFSLSTGVNEATDWIFCAFFFATLRDINCGGLIKVWQFTNEGCFPVVSGMHAIDAAIKVEYPFYETQIFIFDDHTYDQINISSLSDILLGIGFRVVRRPSCLE